ncbi:hypothetical protein JGH11_18740 [Dysgonomonas sp. Marseille-P4677]|uniref:hypothetical protein n=1 Tax=Dysgonomonas sp. Marseille-P4677 TaxID=2364790 RepID=UPI00191265C8|nr:hypothetical protein [Dysgonomonas sp. Marseille-P4677]MBK5722911.1 hypothetical protein [Dysgonomonas sp. Marseille-P4677]
MAMTTPNEGKFTVAIEKQTSKIPSGIYLTASLAAMAASLTLKCCGKNHIALLVGQCATSFLIMGLYNKIVKTEGHD